MAGKEDFVPNPRHTLGNRFRAKMLNGKGGRRAHRGTVDFIRVSVPDRQCAKQSRDGQCTLTGQRMTEIGENPINAASRADNILPQSTLARGLLFWLLQWGRNPTGK
jgi:hypothetical protein